MSLVGHVLWKRSVMGPCASAAVGAAVAGAGAVVGAALRSPDSSREQAATPAATPAAPTAAFFRKLRRVVAVLTAEGADGAFFIRSPLVGSGSVELLDDHSRCSPVGGAPMMRILQATCRVFDGLSRAFLRPEEKEEGCPLARTAAL